MPITPLRRAMRRISLAYRVACAKDDMRLRGLREPVGVWVCGRCRRVLLERVAFVQHLAAHAC